MTEEVVTIAELNIGDRIRVEKLDIIREGTVGRFVDGQDGRYAALTPNGLTLIDGIHTSRIVRLAKAKPAEPKGLGAVIKVKLSASQEKAVFYVRDSAGDVYGYPWWMRAVASHRAWDDFVEVEIISEGVER